MRSPAAAAFSILLVSGLASDAAAVAEEKQPSPATLSNPVAAQPLDQLSATLDRPLFSPTRHPSPPPPPPSPTVQVVAPPPPPPSPPNLVLFGVVIDGEGARAVVRADNKLLRAQIGDDIDGWKVSQIEGRKMVLSLDGRFATFTLFSDGREKQQATGAPMPGNEPKKPQEQSQAQQVPAQAPQTGQPRKHRRSRQ